MFGHHRIPNKIRNSDELINVNCFEYLHFLAAEISQLKLQSHSPVFQNLLNRCGPDLNYDPNFAYGNFYTESLLALECFFETKMLNKENMENYKALLQSIYANKNEALNRSLKVIQEQLDSRRHTSKKFNSRISQDLAPPSEKINKVTPVDANSKWSAIKKYVAFYLKPQSTTSLACVRVYGYQSTENSPKEYRFGTQGQYQNFYSRVSPLFKAWAQANRPDPAKPKKITHVYINNMPTYAKIFQFKLETRLTRRLHEFEKENAHVAVITLPANHGLLSEKVLSHTKALGQKELEKKIQQIIRIFVDPKEGLKHDFQMSPEVRGKLYKDKGAIALVTELLNSSFKDLGLEAQRKSGQLSQAQLQAVYFHFVKFKFTNHILTTLKPASFNMSCWDAIDRGGASSVYYNLLKSIEKKHPMTEVEFLQGLHAAPTMVKGRGMNHQIKALWNAIDAYVSAHEKILKETMPWLIDWRNKNAIKESPNYFLYRFKTFLPKKQNGFFHHKVPEETAVEKIISIIEKRQDMLKFDSEEITAMRSNDQLRKLFQKWQSRYPLPPQRADALSFKKS